MVEIENMRESSQSQSQAHALVTETLKQLEVAKRTVEFLRAADTAKATLHGYNNCSCYKQEFETEIQSLRSALEIAETKYQEEQIQNMVKIMNAYELIEPMKSELERKKVEVEELKAKLMDKEIKFQGIVDQNERLNLKLEKCLSPQSEQELKKQLKRLYECVAELKGDLMDKEKTLLNILEENEMLKVEINKRFTHTHVDMVREEVSAELKASKVAEESLVEKLEAAEAVNLEKEAELKRVKVQCDQWRKAAETAAAIFSEENNNGRKLSERSMSFDNNYYNNVNVQKKNIEYSGFCEEFDDDDEFLKKKNGNVLKKIGVLWKKP